MRIFGRMEDADEPPEDAFEAAVWYRGRAGLGDVDAMFNLGVCYEEGRGVAQDGKLACSWCHKQIKINLKIKKTASTRAWYHKKKLNKRTTRVCVVPIGEKKRHQTRVRGATTAFSKSAP